MIEPTGSHMGLHPIPPRFLQQLRDLTEKTGVIFHMDEVVTGFRISKGGASEKFNVIPDITTLAKILGGGMPGGAVAGKSDLINLIEFQNDTAFNQNQRVSHPGTFNANPVSAAAGAKALELVRDTNVNDKADQAADKLKKNLNELLGKMEIAGQVTGHGSLLFVRLGVHFEVEDDGASFELSDSQWEIIDDSQRNAQLHLALLNEGVDPMSNGTRLIVGQDHSDQDIKDTVSAYEKALIEIRGIGLI
jgi:glutamate-1-semialdehyde 2,1-aminomutase